MFQTASRGSYRALASVRWTKTAAPDLPAARQLGDLLLQFVQTLPHRRLDGGRALRVALGFHVAGAFQAAVFPMPGAAQRPQVIQQLLPDLVRLSSGRRSFQLLIRQSRLRRQVGATHQLKGILQPVEGQRQVHGVLVDGQFVVQERGAKLVHPEIALQAFDGLHGGQATRVSRFDLLLHLGCPAQDVVGAIGQYWQIQPVSHFKRGAGERFRLLARSPDVQHTPGLHDLRVCCPHDQSLGLALFPPAAPPAGRSPPRRSAEAR